MPKEKIIYWAGLLTDYSKSFLLYKIPPLHENIYAEYITLAYKPNKEINSYFNNKLRNKYIIEVTNHLFDEKVQLIIVNGINRVDKKTSHVTISCAKNIKPFYSNTLIKKSKPLPLVDKFYLEINIAKFTSQGWVDKKL